VEEGPGAEEEEGGTEEEEGEEGPGLGLGVWSEREREMESSWCFIWMRAPNTCWFDCDASSTLCVICST